MCEKRAYKCYLLGLIKLKKGKSRRDVVKKQSKMCENKSVKTDKNNPEKLNVFRGYLAHHIGFEPMAFRLGGERSILLS